MSFYTSLKCWQRLWQIYMEIIGEAQHVSRADDGFNVSAFESSVLELPRCGGTVEHCQALRVAAAPPQVMTLLHLETRNHTKKHLYNYLYTIPILSCTILFTIPYNAYTILYYPLLSLHYHCISLHITAIPIWTPLETFHVSRFRTSTSSIAVG